MGAVSPRTALVVLGETDGYQLAVEQELAALFLVRSADGGFSARATPAFSSLFGPGGADGKPAEPAGKGRTE